jgi:osmotically-inducible protein OsmY
MNAPARLALVLLAGLSLAGCATTTAGQKPQPATVAVRSEQPQSARDHWLMREIDDKVEATFASNGSR